MDVSEKEALAHALQPFAAHFCTCDWSRSGTAETSTAVVAQLPSANLQQLPAALQPPSLVAQIGLSVWPPNFSLVFF